VTSPNGEFNRIVASLVWKILVVTFLMTSI